MKNLLIILCILVLIVTCNKHKEKKSVGEEVEDEAIQLMDTGENISFESPLATTITNSSITLQGNNGDYYYGTVNNLGTSNVSSVTLYDNEGNYYYGTVNNTGESDFGFITLHDIRGNYYYGTTWNPNGTSIGTVNLFNKNLCNNNGTTLSTNTRTSSVLQNNNLLLPVQSNTILPLTPPSLPMPSDVTSRLSPPPPLPLPITNTSEASSSSNSPNRINGYGY